MERAEEESKTHIQTKVFGKDSIHLYFVFEAVPGEIQGGRRS